MGFTPETLPDLGGRVYLVTGGNTGIGFHTVLQLAAHHAKVYLCSRSEEKGRAAMKEIKDLLPNAELYLLKMDMTNLQSVVSAANEFCRREKYLHGLVNNAGIMATPFTKTVDGYESQFQTNYLSHWLLTYYLLPTMVETANNSVRGIFGIDLQDVDQANGGPISRYGSSKLASILHAKELARRFSMPEARAAYSGFRSEGNTGANGSMAVIIMGKILSGISKTGLVGLTPEDGALTQLFAVASKEFTREMNGAYLIPIAQVGKPSKKAEDKQMATDLWDWTEKEMKAKELI
ncbi:hypothetical protein N7467_000387 [Penicillium canescens]|nr:hypothetical protein N7467_000387 [Penicillium canescens]